MAINHYFQSGNGIGNDNEKKLHEDLIIEGLKIYGHNCYYLPRTIVNRDLILGEDTLSKFDDSYLIEMYMETTEGFAGEQEIINKFGLEIREDTTFMVSKRSWDLQVGNVHNLIRDGRPNEGDLIFMPLMNSFFEIQFVEDQEPFFQLGNLPVYKLKVTRWEYSSERLNTGISAIDGTEDQYSIDQLQHQITLEDETGSLLLEDENVDGESNYLILESFEVQKQQTESQNIDLDQEAGFDTLSASDDIVDFTERNPFGELDDGEY
jgi:hypothetical protein